MVDQGWSFVDTTDPLSALDTGLPGAVITSGRRTPGGNASLAGSVPNSGHLRGDKVDIVPGSSGLSRQDIADRVSALGGNPLVESDHVDASFPGANFPYVGKRGSEGQGPDHLQLGGWSFVDDQPDQAAPNKGQGWDFVDDKTTSPWKRGLGLGTRDVLEGAGGLLDIIAGPANAAVNALPGQQGLSTHPGEETAKHFSDYLGFPVSQTDTEKLISAANKGGIQALLIGAASLPGAAASGLKGSILSALSDKIGLQTIANSAAGASGEEARQQGYGVVGQLAASLIGGGGVAGIGAASPKLIERLTQMAKDGASPEELRAAAGPYTLKGLGGDNKDRSFEAVDPANDNSGGVGFTSPEKGVTVKDVTKDRQKAAFSEDDKPAINPETGRFQDVSQEEFDSAYNDFHAASRKYNIAEDAGASEKVLGPLRVARERTLANFHRVNGDDKAALDAERHIPQEHMTPEEFDRHYYYPSEEPSKPDLSDPYEAAVFRQQLKNMSDDDLGKLAEQIHKEQNPQHGTPEDLDKLVNDILGGKPVPVHYPANDTAPGQSPTMPQAHAYEPDTNIRYGYDGSNGPANDAHDYTQFTHGSKNPPALEDWIRAEEEYNKHAFNNEDAWADRRTNTYKAWSKKEQDLRAKVDAARDHYDNSDPHTINQDHEGDHPSIEAPDPGPDEPHGPTEPPQEPPSEPPHGPDGEEPPRGDPVQKLIKLLGEAKKVRASQQRLYSAERSRRVAMAAKAQAKMEGEASHFEALGAMKGELPKEDYESILQHFTPDEIHDLHNMINGSDRLHVFDKINASNGLNKMLEGELPQPNQLKLLAQVFPSDMLKALLKARSILSKVYQSGVNILGIPRTVKSSIDLSAPLRQGVTRFHTKEFWQAFANMHRYAVSEEAFQAGKNAIRRDGLYDRATDSGLALTAIDDTGHNGGPSMLSEREEAFISNLPEKIPVFGKLVRGSERAYVGFLNDLRFKTFKNLYNTAKKAGVDTESLKFNKDLAGYINNATGRGSLGTYGNAASPLLSTIFYSPRLQASRVQLINPIYYATLSPFVRREAIKSALAFGGLVGGVLGLAKLSGAKVETDPRSADFAKIKIKAPGGLTGVAEALPGIYGVGVQTYGGNTREDIQGGFQQYARFSAEMATNQTKTGKGEIQTLGAKYGSSTRLGVAGQFARNKLAPIPSFVADWADGKNVVGEKFSVPKETAALVAPMFMNDLYDAYNNDKRTTTQKNKAAQYQKGW